MFKVTSENRRHIQDKLITNICNLEFNGLKNYSRNSLVKGISPKALVKSQKIHCAV